VTSIVDCGVGTCTGGGLSMQYGGVGGSATQACLQELLEGPLQQVAVHKHAVCITQLPTPAVSC
jgi:hypothetical protein